ncbi:MAG TPA: sigma-54 dependent transcriptional regulator [Candidatus Binataceae bacterium]|nr:sigma-54 dependent transcriptional regulator [Candidatus Binataceae bacterium]
MIRAPRILVVDDTLANRSLLQATFELEGFTVTLAERGEDALSGAAGDLPDLVLLDLRMPGMDGMEALSRFKALAAELPVIVLTSHGEVAEAVEAIKRGADDFLIRPIENDRLVITVKRSLERCELKTQVKNLRSLVDRQGYLARLIAPSPRMHELVELIRQVAGSNFTVLIQGETGTGKELVARAIHQESPRADKPFIAIDAGAIPDTLVESELFGHEKGSFSGAERRKEGYFQMANAGTLFLDEVSNLPLPSQPKLLRVIQERQVRPVGASRALPVDVRIIAACNEDLHQHVDKGLFRQDLYYRLAEFVISLPPLRERREDILPLAKCFLDEASVELKRSGSIITGEAASLLQACPWPGNIRQLRNVMRRAALQTTGAVISGKAIQPLLQAGHGLSPEPLAPVPAPGPGEMPTAPNGAESLRDIARSATEAAEKHAIIEALRATGGNKQKAATRLKTDYKTLFVKLKRYGLGNARPAAPD